MFDMGIGDIMNNAAALKEAQDDKRIEAMKKVLSVIDDMDNSYDYFSAYAQYYYLIRFLLENDYYNALEAVDFDVLYRLIAE